MTDERGRSSASQMFNKIREILGLTDTPTQGGAHRSSDISTNQSTDHPPESDVPAAPDDSAEDRDAREAPAAAGNTIETQRIGSVFVLKLTDSRILDQHRIQSIGYALESLFGDTVKGVVLDFGRVEFMSAAMLASLIPFRKRCLSDSIELRLCSLSPEIYEVFKATQLSKIFVVDPDRTASLSRLLAPEGFPFPSSEADWLVCADWWEERGHESIAQACRVEADRCRASRRSHVSS